MDRDAIVAAYPRLYRLRQYFACDDGWLPLIARLSEKLEPLMVNEDYYAVDVKEKYGTLRFYISGYSDEIYEYIDAAERESAITCEVCSNSGTLCHCGYWYKTLCPVCAEKLGYREYRKDAEV